MDRFTPLPSDSPEFPDSCRSGREIDCTVRSDVGIYTYVTGSQVAMRFTLTY